MLIQVTVVCVEPQKTHLPQHAWSHGNATRSSARGRALRIRIYCSQKGRKGERWSTCGALSFDNRRVQSGGGAWVARDAYPTPLWPARATIFVWLGSCPRAPPPSPSRARNRTRRTPLASPEPPNERCSAPSGTAYAPLVRGGSSALNRRAGGPAGGRVRCRHAPAAAANHGFSRDRATPRQARRQRQQHDRSWFLV